MIYFQCYQIALLPKQSSFTEKRMKGTGGIIFLTNIYQSKQETLNAKLKHNHKVNFKLRKGHKKHGPFED